MAKHFNDMKDTLHYADWDAILSSIFKIDQHPY